MKLPADDPTAIHAALQQAVEASRADSTGAPASYIPELAQVPLERTSAAITLRDGTVLSAGDAQHHRFTLQSSAKLVVLIGLLEELGHQPVFDVVGCEPSGSSFASLARLETHGPSPANPLINTGAIALAGLIPGTLEQRLAWIGRWAERLYGQAIAVRPEVLSSERISGDRNRSIAYLLKSGGLLTRNVDETLEVYFSLCSLEATVMAASHLPTVLAMGGRQPGSGTRVIAQSTAMAVISLMATCGMYDESGDYLCSTGLPAKSGVSGVIVAVAPSRAGIAVCSPRINPRGGSIRGHLILRQLSKDLGWHFALPR